MSGVTKNPTDERVEAWLRRVRLKGGRPAGACRGQDLLYEVATETRHVHSCCCGGETKADVPYSSAINGEATLYARVCAVCDAATEFPRLKP